jgi:hypothetical protein
MGILAVSYQLSAISFFAALVTVAVDTFATRLTRQQSNRETHSKAES